MNSGNGMMSAIGATILWAVCFSAAQAYQMGGFENFSETFLSHTERAIDSLPYATTFAAVTGLVVWLLSGGRVSMFTGYSVTMVANAVKAVFSAAPHLLYYITDHGIFSYFIGAFCAIAIGTSVLPGLSTSRRRKETGKSVDREVVQQTRLVNDVKIVE